jgi:hypothetical protein
MPPTPLSIPSQLLAFRSSAQIAEGNDVESVKGEAGKGTIAFPIFRVFGDGRDRLKPLKQHPPPKLRDLLKPRKPMSG